MVCCCYFQVSKGVFWNDKLCFDEEIFGLETIWVTFFKMGNFSNRLVTLLTHLSYKASLLLKGNINIYSMAKCVVS